MKPLNRIGMLFAVALLAYVHSTAQYNAAQKSSEPKPERKIWVRLKSGEILSGNLVKMDPESVDFTDEGVPHTVACDELIGVTFVPPSPMQSSTPTAVTEGPILPMTASLKPTILYREKAGYTPKAKAEGVQGTVVLQVVFHANGIITEVKVIQGLPHGLNDQAIEAAKTIRFIPAMKDGKPISVRGRCDFTFILV